MNTVISTVKTQLWLLVVTATVVAAIAATALFGSSGVSTLNDSASPQIAAEQTIDTSTDKTVDVAPSTRTVGAGDIQLASNYNAYGCVGLLNAKQWQVLAFVVGYCPTTWVLQSTSWGRSIVNYVVGVACKSPWIVRAATGGKYSSC